MGANLSTSQRKKEEEAEVVDAKDSKILVLGAGSFGTCLGNHLADLQGIFPNTLTIMKGIMLLYTQEINK
jgi:hypothetical protein